jgi:hypothetical protein
VLPRDLQSISLLARQSVAAGQGVGLRVEFQDSAQKRLAAVLPFHISLSRPDGKVQQTYYRATTADGTFAITLPIPANAPAGQWSVTVRSQLNGSTATLPITVAAPASAVWPWLAQMGPAPRGGAYTYDWIENLLGLDMHSADQILPELQHPAVGDTIGLGANRMRIERVEPHRVLAWRSEDGNWVWTFILEEGNGSTRLISRNRFRLPTLAARIGMVPMESGSLVMERKMLLGIKKRAERLARSARA